MRESCCAMPFRLGSQLLSVHLLERLCAEPGPARVAGHGVQPGMALMLRSIRRPRRVPGVMCSTVTLDPGAGDRSSSRCWLQLGRLLQFGSRTRKVSRLCVVVPRLALPRSATR